MQDTREKLIELLTQVAVLGDYLDMGKVADHLIANGVTFAEDINVPSNWIPVTERLPDEDGWYLCFIYPVVLQGAGYCTILPYDKNGFRTGYVYTIDVTHWMPLPEPPKGE